MSCDENSLKHNKQTSSSEVKTKTVSFIGLSRLNVRFSLPESMMKDLPFISGWRWDFSLSLEKDIEGAADVVLQWISFWVVKLPRLHDAQLWIVFSFKYRWMALCMILRDSSWLVPLFLLSPRRRTLYSGPCQVRAPPFVSRYIFQDEGFDTGTSCGGRSFIHCFVKWVKRLRIFIHRDRIELLNCFVWNYREPLNMYLDGYKFVIV